MSTREDKEAVGCLIIIGLILLAISGCYLFGPIILFLIAIVFLLMGIFL